MHLVILSPHFHRQFNLLKANHKSFTKQQNFILKMVSNFMSNIHQDKNDEEEIKNQEIAKKNFYFVWDFFCIRFFVSKI